MTRVHRFIRVHEDEERDAARQTASLAALALLLLLVVLGLFLVRALSSEAVVEDCLIAGRRNCDAVLVAQPKLAPW